MRWFVENNVGTLWQLPRKDSIEDTKPKCLSYLQYDPHLSCKVMLPFRFPVSICKPFHMTGFILREKDIYQLALQMTRRECKFFSAYTQAVDSYYTEWVERKADLPGIEAQISDLRKELDDPSNLENTLNEIKCLMLLVARHRNRIKTLEGGVGEDLLEVDRQPETRKPGLSSSSSLSPSKSQRSRSPYSSPQKCVGLDLNKDTFASIDREEETDRAGQKPESNEANKNGKDRKDKTDKNEDRNRPVPSFVKVRFNEDFTRSRYILQPSCSRSIPWIAGDIVFKPSSSSKFLCASESSAKESESYQNMTQSGDSTTHILDSKEMRRDNGDENKSCQGKTGDDDIPVKPEIISRTQNSHEENVAINRRTFFFQALIKASQGCRSGMFKFCKKHEQELKDNEELCSQLYEFACRDTSGDGLYVQGWMLANGFGIKEDSDAAMICFHMSAELGNVYGQSHLGRCYEDGLGVPRSLHTAFQWYQQAAMQGEQFAMYHIGRFYTDGLGGCPVNSAEALKWFHKSSQLGVQSATLEIGRIYMDGEGVEVDQSKGIEWIKKAALDGKGDDAIAIHVLATCYESGEGFGGHTNINEALRLYQRAAALGSREAVESLRRIGNEGF